MSVVGVGTALNVATVVAGSLAGLAIGSRLPERTRGVVTDALGLVTLLVAGLSAAEITAPALAGAVGPGAPVLVVLGSLLLGGIAGSLLRLEERLEALAERVQTTTGGGSAPAGADGSREHFVEGWLTATLLFCVGPLTILGSLDDGLGRGIDKLALKATLDGFAALAFASTFGIGVLFSAVSVLLVQGSLTLLGMGLGAILPEAHIVALTATGGLILAGISLRLLQIRTMPVADLLPALLVAPLLTELVARLR